MKLLKILGLMGIASLMTQSAQAQCIIGRASIQDSSQCDTSIRHQILAVGYNTQGISMWNNLTYQWSTGETSMSIFANAGSTYAVTITDANGCTATDAFAVTRSFSVPNITLNVVQDACNNSGAIVQSATTGGQLPYSYYWSNGVTTQDVSGLPGGYQSLSVVDAVGCAGYATVQINGAGAYTYPQITSASCNQSNGSVRLFAQNAQTYLWNTGSTASTISGLSAGWYGVTITDAASQCFITQQYQVGYDPNCETVISGNILNISSTGVCSGGVPLSTACVRLQNTQTNQIEYAWPDNSGYYEFRTRVAGTYVVRGYFFNGLTSQCPASSEYNVTVTASGSTIANQDFYAAYPNGLDVDAEVWGWGARPGSSMSMYVPYCNYGNQPVSNGTIVLTYDPMLSFVSSAPYGYSFGGTPATFVSNNPTTHQVTHSYSLNSGECAYILMTFDVPTTAQLGDLLDFSVIISPIMNDANPVNNTDSTLVTVVNSYDPNDKRAYPFRQGSEWDGKIFATDTKMEYIIRFQNTGNAPAVRIEVRDTLEANLLVETIRDVYMSHEGTLRANGNALSFEFNNIYLADATHNEPESHGYIKFTIDRNPNLQLGSSVRNSAAIYFDFNAPVITNTATSTLFEILAVAETNAADIDLRAMPNPFDKQINVQLELPTASDVRISMINALGQTVRSVSNNRAQAAGVHQYQIEADDLASGMYWILVETSTGRYAHKIVKQ